MLPPNQESTTRPVQIGATNNGTTSSNSPKRAPCPEMRERMQHCFTLTVSADNQQSKLVPSWGKTEQPGSMYYLQEVSHDIFGIVDNSEEQSIMYLFDEHIGP